jgi:hypothetical protein
MKTPLTQQRLRELLHYDPLTGLFTRLVAASNAPAGSAAGSLANIGYLRISVDGARYLAHRLAWLYVHGEWPQQEIDHINGDKIDNRIANLRDASRGVNCQNIRAARRDSKTGLLGVYERRGRFTACIEVSGRTVTLGDCATPTEAHAVYLQAKREFHAGCTI